MTTKARAGSDVFDLRATANGQEARPEPIIECLFAQIELLAKPTGNFGKLRLALVIELRTLAD